MYPRLVWNSQQSSCLDLLSTVITGLSFYVWPDYFFAREYALFVSFPLDLIPAIFCVASKTQNYISQAPFQVASMKVQPVRVLGRRAEGRKIERPHISAHSALGSISASVLPILLGAPFPSSFHL